MSKASQLGRGGETTTCTLGFREETLKLAPAWGAGTGERVEEGSAEEEEKE